MVVHKTGPDLSEVEVFGEHGVKRPVQVAGLEVVGAGQTEEAIQRITTENTTLKKRIRQLTAESRTLDERLKAARSNLRFQDRRIADLEARLADPGSALSATGPGPAAAGESSDP